MLSEPNDIGPDALSELFLETSKRAQSSAADPGTSIGSSAMERVAWLLTGASAQRASLAFGRLPNVDCERLAASLRKSCTQYLAAMLQRTLVLELHIARLRDELDGDTPELRFDSFVRRFAGHPGVWAELAADYPALSRHVHHRLVDWSTNRELLAQRLSDDWKLLVGEDGDQGWTLVDIEDTSSDPHRGGQRVCIVTFERMGETLRWVYKPRSLAIDLHFLELVEWANARNLAGELRFEADQRCERLAELPRLEPWRIVDRGTYGWGEFYGHSECADEAALARFYARQGLLLALCYLVQGTDLHHENLIAAGEHPVLTDLETLFHPDLDSDLATARDKAERLLERSVLRTMMLPGSAWGDDDHGGINIGGLGEGLPQQTPTAVDTWVDTGTDRMRVGSSIVALQPAKNVPKLAGKPASVSLYATELMAGFVAMMRCVLRNRSHWLDRDGLLERFANDRARRIVRPTAIYTRLLQLATHPDNVQSIEEYESQFDCLATLRDSAGRLQPLIAAEIAELRRGDVPYFCTAVASRDLRDGLGNTVTSFFDVDALTRARQHVESCDESTIQEQLRWIRASIVSLCAGREDHPPDRLTWTRPLAPLSSGSDSPAKACAARIAEQLLDSAIEHDGRATWIGLEFAGVDGKARVTALGADLQSGSAGIGLFLAYAWRAIGDERLREASLAAARQTITQLRNEPLVQSGGFFGWPSQLYALAHISAVFDEPDLLIKPFGAVLDRAIQTLSDPAVLTDEATLSTGRGLDITYGVSGAALALASVWQVAGLHASLDLIALCGHRLVATAQTQEPGLAWPSQFARPLLGFSHGSAGFAAALLASSRLLADVGWNREEVETFRRAGQRALAYERLYFDEVNRNWPDFRREPPIGTMVGWCHGALSVAQGRMCHGSDLDDDDVVDLRRAIDLAHEFQPEIRQTDVLCHGEVGNLLIIDRATRMLGDDNGHRENQERLKRLVRRLREQGPLTQNGLPDVEPALMLGMAGIGYGLLALDDPSIPSVLGLEAPSGAKG